MIHKFNTRIPSKFWLIKRLRPHFYQRRKFLICTKWFGYERLLSKGFSADEPILCNGIFSNVMKTEKCILLMFRGCMFEQGSLQEYGLWGRASYVRKFNLPFELDDMISPDFNLNALLGRP